MHGHGLSALAVPLRQERVSRARAMKRKSRTRAQRVAIFDRDNGICGRCGEPIDTLKEDWHIGHIIALSCGGEDTDENVAPEHASCNMQDCYETTIPKASKIGRVRANHLGVPKDKSRSFNVPRGARYNWQKGRYEWEPANE